MGSSHDFAIPSRETPSRKRRYSVFLSPLPIDAEPPRRKQKVDHPPFPPPKFWDNLSKKRQIPLTKNSLRELTRRNTWRERTDVPRLPPVRRSRRLAARRTKEGNKPALPVNELKRFASHGGPDLADLKGYRPPTPIKSEMRSSTPSSLGRRKRGSQSPEKRSGTSGTTTTRSTGPYDRAFHQHLVDHGIFPDSYEYPDGEVLPEPENIEEILEALGQPRPSLSPSRFSREDFREFKRANNHATKESQVMKTVIPIIEGDIGDPKCAAGDIPFSNLDHLTDGTLVSGKPDYYHGARPEQIDRRIRAKLSGAIIPSTQDDLPAAPNFFIEAKGPDGSAAVAKRQITYDTALGERGQTALLDYGELEPTSDNKAHTIGCTLQDGHLKMYATHRIHPSKPEAQAEYLMTQVKAWALTGDADAFREGAKAYRNARDWAKRQRDEAIEKANESAAIPDADTTLLLGGLGLSVSSQETAAETAERASQVTTTNHGSNAPSFHDSDTSADELSLGLPSDKRVKGIRKMLKSSSRSRQSSQESRKDMHSAKRVNGGSAVDVDSDR